MKIKKTITLIWLVLLITSQNLVAQLPGFLINSSNPQHNCRIPDFTQIPVPNLFSLGGMGGYYTLSEMENLLDTLRVLYPNLISGKQEISGIRSVEDREIWYVKISNNPDTNQNKPQVLFTSLHHSQEPASLQQLMFFITYLLENYSNNSLVDYLVNNLELYFMPCINPDGYVYNEIQNPQGGGLWRKNRRDNGLFSSGVDLNRNYGYMWAYDNIGSHGVGSSPWYRGTEAFSEPEAQAVKEFVESKNFLLCLNWHSYGNLIIFPWNYRNIYTADSTQFFEYAKEISLLGRYTFGTVAETYGYQSNGDADDWFYGETDTKNKIISMTGEIGSFADGFWPDTSRIIPLCLEALDVNLKYAALALAYARVYDKGPELLSTHNGYIPFDILCMGVDTPSSFQISFTALSPQLSFPASSGFLFQNMQLFEKQTDSVFFQIESSAINGQEIAYVIAINNGLYAFNDTVRKIFGNPIVLFVDDCESFDNWTSNKWGITNEDAYSGNYAINDSPNTTYGLFANAIITLQQTIDLHDKTAAWLSFFAKWDIERNHDYLKVEASVNQGDTWTHLCGTGSSFGNDNLDFPDPVYDGYQTEWIRQEISLHDFLGQEVMLRFRLVSDQTNGNYKGFFFDDIQVYALDATNAGTEKVMSDLKTSLYPNPANDIIVFNANNTGGKFVIFSPDSKPCLHKSISNKNTTINISHLPQGFYLWTYHDGISKTSGKIAIIR